MMSHEDRCRELAELRTIAAVVGSSEMPYDPRFAALRGEHDLIHDSENWGTCAYCHRVIPWPDEDGTYCLRTDGDALDEAIAACGYSCEFSRDDEWYEQGLESYFANLDNDIIGRGMTPREAKSAALWQAVFKS